MSKAYETVAARILDLIAQGVNPWQRGWRQAAHRPPTNLVSMKPYRGINNLFLGLTPYASPYWLTFKQALARGGHVRKGEKAQLAIFWTKHTSRIEAQPDGSELTIRKEYEAPIMRFYYVFNVEQCENVNAPEAPTPTTYTPHEINARAQAIVDAMPNAPKIVHTGSQPCYIPALDVVQMPALEQFHNAPSYYATTFHELAHATGHATRLNREFGARFGDDRYSREELIAEMTSAYLCGAAGILDDTADQSAAYLSGWASKIKEDPRAIITAAARAQAAADYILDRKPEQETSEQEAAQ